MKKINYLLFLFAATCILFSSCSPEDANPVDDSSEVKPTKTEGISDETKNSIPVDLGEIGIVFDTRKLASLGYKPTKVNLVIDGALSTYSQNDIAVDRYSNLAIFRIATKDLNEADIASFSEGVKITATVFDENGNELESQVESKLIVKAESKPVPIETEKPIVLEARAYNPNISYYLQCISGPGGADVSNENPLFLGAKTIDPTNGDEVEYYDRGTMGLTSHDPTPESPYAQSQKFYFESQGNNMYAIKVEFEQCYLESSNGLIYWDKNVTDNSLLEDKHMFVLDFTEDGYITITPYNDGIILQSYTNGAYAGIVQTEYSGDADEDLKFRVLSTGVTWEYETVDTQYSKPIIPKTKMDWGFQNIVSNCGNITWTDTYGVKQVQKSEFNTTSGESLQLYGSNTKGWSASISASTEVSFFGNGVEVTATGSLSGESTKGFENTYETTTSKTYGEEKEFSKESTVTIPPKTAVEIYSATQIIENVRMPFVTRIRVRGTVDKVKLTSDEIVSQIVTSRFPGVITDEGVDYVEVSIRGHIDVDKYFKTESNSIPIDGACD